MSRWDALKPTTRQQGKQRRRQQNHANSNTLEHNSDYVSRAWDKLTTDLRGEETQEKNEINSKRKNSSLSDMICRLQQIHETSSRISPNQCGNAVAAALHRITVVSNDNLKISLLQFSLHVLQDRRNNIRLTRFQARTCVLTLRQEYDSLNSLEKYDSIEIVLLCLCRIVVLAVAHLPPEDTANQIVGHILLRFLENSVNVSNQDFRNGESQALALEAVNSLLEDKKHASALLAPIMDDVKADGSEYHYQANPLRSRIFQMLQKYLDWLSNPLRHDASDILSDNVCRCMSTALKMATHHNAVIKNILLCPHDQSKPDADVDVTKIEQFVKHAIASDMNSTPPLNQDSTLMRRKRQIVAALELMDVYIKKYPTASSVLGTSLLLNCNFERLKVLSDKEQCSICSYNCCSSRFLYILHGSTDHIECGLIMTCTAGILASMPLKLWLGKNQSPQINISNLTFGKRVSEAVENVIRITRCLCIRGDLMTKRTIEPLSQLLRTVLLKIPYYKNEGRIMMVACTLLETLAIVLLGPMHRFAVMTDVFVDCMGGHTTPEGSLAPMITPAEVWLSGSSSDPFKVKLFSNAKSDHSDTAKHAMKLLRAIVRTRPKTLWQEDCGVNWGKFKDVILLHTKPKGPAIMQVASLQLLEGLLKGKRDFWFEKKNAPEVVAFASTILPKFSPNPNAQCRSVSFDAYGAFVGSDWFLLSQQNEGSCLIHFNLILKHCLATASSDTGSETVGESSAKVRISACKAIGEICCHCFGDLEESRSSGDAGKPYFADSDVQIICNSVHSTMAEVIPISKASERSMAVFAVGNLAQAMRGKINSIVTDLQLLCRLCVLVRDCMDDSDDKVASNAIRSIGHLGSVLLEDIDQESLKIIQWDEILFFQQVVQRLSGRVSAAVFWADEGKLLSWKQRSITKKHGRVACNSLALFMTTRLRHEENGEVFQSAIQSLLECLKCQYLMNDKIAISAMMAIRCLDVSDLALISGKTGLVGNALTVCILCIFAEEESCVFPVGCKFAKEMELLLEHLLASASIMDAYNVIRTEEISSSHLEELYVWMVEHVRDATAFDAFALAMQKPGLDMHVSIEQKFSSRALNLLRNENISESLQRSQDDDEL